MCLRQVRAELERSLRRSFRVVIRLDEADPERMRPGMSVRAEVLPAPLTDVLVVPRHALELKDDAARALLADGSEVDVSLTYPVNEEVTVGVKYADYMEDGFGDDTTKAWLWISYAP